MDVESPEGSGRVRVRAEGSVDPQTQRGVFRIMDQTGSLLRRIRGARHSQEALALYWRSVGAAISGATMSHELDRRIRRAHAGDALRQAMATPELPFEADPSADGPTVGSDPEPEASPGGYSAASRRRLRPRKATALPQIDLFRTATAEPDAVGREVEAGTDAAAEVEAAISEPAVATPPTDPEPRTLTAEAVMLQRVDPRHLRPTDRSDSYLYHIANGPDAEVALRQGLVVNASDPMILTERQGVSYWLSVLAEDYDYIMDGPADFVVLRLRRMAVEGLLEPDPRASRSSGFPCYLLTGRRTA